MNAKELLENLCNCTIDMLNFANANKIPVIVITLDEDNNILTLGNGNLNMIRNFIAYAAKVVANDNPAEEGDLHKLQNEPPIAIKRNPGEIM